MVNSVMLVGRLSREVEIVVSETGEKYSSIDLSVPRAFKNADGEYDTDLLPVVLWEGLSTNVKEYCHKGDLVGVRGRLQNEKGEVKVIAEKVTFLSSKKSEAE